MKPLLRLLSCLLAFVLLLTGCASLHSCVHADEPDAFAAEREALWEKLKAERPADSRADGDALTVVVIDVGQGDSILLISPEGKTMLVDAGPADAFDAVDATLRANGVESLDVVVATHPHADHIGAMRAVQNAYPVGAYYTNRDVSGGMNIPWADSCTVTVLSPIPSYDVPEEVNDTSVVLHVRYGETAVLLTGDAEATAEGRMLDTYPRSMLKADVLKLGHHGSSTSSYYAFFLAVDPDYAVASCGKDNEYGHPHLETLSLLYETRTAFYRTDCDGSVTFWLNGETVSVECSRKEIP